MGGGRLLPDHARKRHVRYKHAGYLGCSSKLTPVDIYISCFVVLGVVVILRQMNFI